MQTGGGGLKGKSCKKMGKESTENHEDVQGYLIVQNLSVLR